jgi:chaperone modulatory protein CbpM
MIPIASVLQRVAGLDEAELIAWVERRWVRADASPDGYRFQEVDVARVRLILDIRRDCAVDEDAMPLVLSLLDQVYRLRRQLKVLSEAVAAQPEDIRERVLDALARGS